jgi:ABC-2 type transport system permease protein
VESYPDVLKSLFGISEGASIASGAGFLDVELFGFMLPLLVLVLAIGSGARTFAGEEDAGRLELLLSYPVRRRDAVLAKGAAVGVEVVLVSVATGAALVVLDPVFDLGLRAGNVLGALVTLAALGLAYGWLALGIGAALGHRALAIGVAAGTAAAAYLVNGLHELAGWLDPLRFLSPFWLVGSSPLQGNTDYAGVLAVAVLAATFLVAGALLAEGRDLQVP